MYFNSYQLLWINLSLGKQGQIQNKIRSDYLNQGYCLETEIFLIKIDDLDNFDLNLSVCFLSSSAVAFKYTHTVCDYFPIYLLHVLQFHWSKEICECMPAI